MPQTLSAATRRARYLKGCKIKYLLTDTAVRDLFRESAGHCGICGRRFSSRDPVIDHDHQTSEVRGLLCNRCNSLLGFADDDIALLGQAAVYLRETGIKSFRQRRQESHWRRAFHFYANLDGPKPPEDGK